MAKFYWLAHQRTVAGGRMRWHAEEADEPKVDREEIPEQADPRLLRIRERSALVAATTAPWRYSVRASVCELPSYAGARARPYAPPSTERSCGATTPRPIRSWA